MNKVEGWLYWAGFQALSAVLAVVGIPLIALACTFKAWNVGSCTAPWMLDEWCYRWTWSGMDLWDNDENGITGLTADGNNCVKPTWWSAFYWSALRNPVNNLRFILDEGFWIVPVGQRVTITHYTSWCYVVTAGWRQCVTLGPIRFGWRMDNTTAPGYRVWPVLGKS